MKSHRSIIVLMAFTITLNVGLSHAMLPPPMLRAVCGAFADAEEVVGNKALAAGKAAVDLALKPIAIVGGLKAAAVGTGMKIGGGAIKFVGAKMVKDGALMEGAGAGMKGAGLGVAALSVKPLAEKVIMAGKGAEGTIAAAEKLAGSIGDTSVQIAATIDSPIVGHHHKEVNMSAGVGAAQATQTVQQQETEQQQQQHSVSKRAAKVDPEVMRAAISLVRDAKLEDCVHRAICDLNCNPQGFGQDGKQVFMNMVRLQGSNTLEQSETKSFQDAAAKGRANSGKCDQCASVYKNCNSKSSDLIKMASHIRMD